MAGWSPNEVFYLGVSRYNNPPYDHSITWSADHLRQVNSNSLHNFHSLNPCHSQSSHYKGASLSTPLLVSNPSNDFKISLQLRIPCTQSYHAPAFKKLLSPHPPPPIGSLPLAVELRIRQENLELTAFRHSLDNTRNAKTLYCLHPASTLLGAKQTRTKWCYSNQPEVMRKCCSRMTLLPQQTK